MNPTASEVVARLSLAGVSALVDMLGDGAHVARVGGAFEVAVPARVVRMMAVDV